MSFRVDHIVILVADLEAAISDYRQLGFIVTLGGEHTDKATSNALVSFADGSYLELLAFGLQTPSHRWWRHRVYGEGLIDMALAPDDLAKDISAIAARGVTYSGPHAGGRQRPDGQKIGWELGL